MAVPLAILEIFCAIAVVIFLFLWYTKQKWVMLSV